MNCLRESCSRGRRRQLRNRHRGVPRGRDDPKPLKWPTIDKINSVMSQVYARAQRQGLISASMDCNPFRPPKFGGVRCKTQSDYEALVVNPEQMIAILGELDEPETRLVPGELVRWQDFTQCHIVTSKQAKQQFANHSSANSPVVFVGNCQK